MLNADAPEWHPPPVQTLHRDTASHLSGGSAPAGLESESQQKQSGFLRFGGQQPSGSRQRCRSRRDKRRNKGCVPTAAQAQECTERNGNKQVLNTEMANDPPTHDDKGSTDGWPALQSGQWVNKTFSAEKPPLAVVDVLQQLSSDDEDNAVFYVSSSALACAGTDALAERFTSMAAVHVKWLDRFSALALVPGVSLSAATTALRARHCRAGEANLGIVPLPELRRVMHSGSRSQCLDFNGKPCALHRIPLAGELSFLLDQISLTPPHCPAPPAPPSSDPQCCNASQSARHHEALSSEWSRDNTPLRDASVRGSPSQHSPAEAGLKEKSAHDGAPGLDQSLLLRLAGAVPHIVGALWPPRRVLTALRTCTALRACLLAHARTVILEGGPSRADTGHHGGGSENCEDSAVLAGGGGGRRPAPSARDVEAMIRGLSCPGVSLCVKCRHSEAAGRVLIGLHAAVTQGWSGTLSELDLSFSQCDFLLRAGVGHAPCELEALVGLLQAQGGGLQRLNLRENWGGGEGAALLGAGLVTCTALQDLDLSYNRLGEGTRHVIAGLEGTRALQRVGLAGNQMGDAGCRQLAVAMECWQDLRRLDVSSNGLTGGGAEAVTKALRGCTRVDTLAMGGNKLMGGEGAMWLAGAVAGLRDLHTLDVSGNVMGEDGMAALAGALLGCRGLVRLELGGNAIGAGGARELRAVLEAFGHGLSRLGLRANHIGGGEGARQLARGLGACSVLASLDLGSNGFGPGGAATVVGALQGHASTLRELGLRHNALGRRGVRAWRTVLCELSGLTDLDLSYNELRGEGAGVMVEGLQASVKLRRLDLERNLIGGREAVKLAQMLVPLTELRSLNMLWNLLREEGGARLDNGIWTCGGMRPFRGGHQDVTQVLRETLPACKVLI